jgi:hypothetical protein
MSYRDDLSAAHARIDVLERENRALANELERLRTPPDWSRTAVVAAPMAMEPVRRSPVDLGDLLGAARIVIFLFIVLNALVLDFAR